MLITLIFIIGYAFIAFEHPVKINKTASALITGVLCWIVYILSQGNHDLVSEQLYHHMGEIAGILFFLLGAMAIVELIDAHNGFEVITRKIKTTYERKLLWTICIIAFFLSAIIDNLTTTIVMISLLRRLIDIPQRRMFYAGMVIISANAGGAWTPTGDVTTTMLWIGEKITTLNIMKELLLPAIISMIVPLLYFSFKMKGKLKPVATEQISKSNTTPFEQKLILYSGLGAMIFVPVFKTLTGLPPFMGMLFSLGVLWVMTAIIHKNKNEEEKDVYSVVAALRRSDVTTILFFLGILLAVAALESSNQLSDLAGYMDKKIGNLNIIVISTGLLSAVIDNVPLVAATMGMYDFPVDHYFWEFIAYCAGTGGSILILGSAAGVAAMGMEKMDFMWYLKRFSLPALLGYFAGALMYMAQNYLFD